MRKILLSLGVIIGIAAIVASATGAFFNDTETSSGNVFTAGAIDLLVDSQAHYAGLYCDDGVWVYDSNVVAATTRPDLLGDSCSGTWEMTDLGPTNTFFNLGDLKPGDDGENTISLHINNNDAYVCAVVNNLVDDDNGLTEPESQVDTTGGAGQGELSQELHFFAWADNADGENIEAGNNIWNAGEPPLFSNTEGPASDVLDGVSYPLYTPVTSGGVGPLAGGADSYIGMYWCYGDISVDSNTNTLSCSGTPVTNLTQTDSMEADISFYVEQARNNSSFTCPSPEQIVPDVNGSIVHQADLFTSSTSHALGAGDKWFFYDDTSDFSMGIDQFSGSAGANHMALTAGAEGALMTLGNEATPRYNIATYQFAGTALSSISALKYRVYDATADSDKPFLNFNIDFNNSNVWQKRLVYVPTGLTANTWTTVDAIQGGAATWTYSGTFWPAGAVDVSGTTPGTTLRSWSDILANYPSAKILSSDPWLGVRVGEPGPAAASATVDWIQFNGNTYDFKI